MIKELGEKGITLKETSKEGIKTGKKVKCLVKVVLDNELKFGEIKQILQNNEDEKSIELIMGMSHPTALMTKNLPITDSPSLVENISSLLNKKVIGTIEEKDQFVEKIYNHNYDRFSHNLFEIVVAVKEILVNNAETLQ